jgi:CheY-like chemotaxis protein
MRKPRGLRVLVVEDQPEAAEALALAFRAQGHEVAVAPDGPSALEAVRAAQPDVAFLDILLPGTDGCEVAKGIRRLSAGRRPLLVALTGLGDESSRRRTDEAGIDLHLVKPVHPATLHGLLRRFETFLQEVEASDTGA